MRLWAALALVVALSASCGRPAASARPSPHRPAPSPTAAPEPALVAEPLSVAGQHLFAHQAALDVAEAGVPLQDAVAKVAGDFERSTGCRLYIVAAARIRVPWAQAQRNVASWLRFFGFPVVETARAPHRFVAVGIACP